MQTAAIVIGIIAGVFGLLGGGCVVAIGGVVEGFGAEGAEVNEIYIRGALAVVAAIVGMVGASLSIAKPKRASIIMIVAGIVGAIAVDTFVFSTILFGMAA